jgi:hypothetical protein
LQIAFNYANTTEFADAWKTKNTCAGLLGNTFSCPLNMGLIGNQFMKDLLPLHVFKLINRAFSLIDIELEQKVNDISKQYWSPSYILCCDENNVCQHITFPCFHSIYFFLFSTALTHMIGEEVNFKIIRRAQEFTAHRYCG